MCDKETRTPVTHDVSEEAGDHTIQPPDADINTAGIWAGRNWDSNTTSGGGVRQ